MQTVQDISEFKRKGSHPLEIQGRNIYELAQTDPEAAYKMVFEAVDRRGGHKVLIDHRLRQSCIGAARAKPLPGSAENAFLKGAISIGDFIIFEVMPVHLKCLQLVNSPLLELAAAAMSKDGAAKREIEFDDEWNICFIFTHDPEVLYDTPKAKLKELIETGAREQFKPSKTNAVNSATVNGICAAVVKQFERHIATSVRFASEVEGQAEKKSS
jgi:hypothetical protein